MAKIYMCGYYGMCDSNGNCIGHTKKVTEEYYSILSESHDVEVIASPCVINNVAEDIVGKTLRLPYDIVVDVPFTLSKRIFDKWKIMKNVHECMKKTDKETCFFYQVDFFFFLYIYLFYNKRMDKKLYCLIYHQDFTGGKLERILQHIYQKALSKMDGVIYTQREMKVAHTNVFWMPDYIYDESKYLKYREMDKKEKVVCLGTMNRYKELEKLVDVFGQIDYPLEIIGRFDDYERYQKLLQQKSNNILIQNTVLSEEEYYTKLGEAKYSILPYCIEQYVNRTSGVLLESLYVGSIPIAPQIILDQNKMPGYGYCQIEELCQKKWLQENLPADKKDIAFLFVDKKTINDFFIS